MLNTIEALEEIKKIEKDEKFKKIDTELNRFISNYGRVVALVKGKYQIEKIYGGTDSNIYYYVKCKNKASSNYNGKLYIHRLVAEAFCKKPNSWHSKCEVHHIVKFNPKLSNEVNNVATNLMWVEKKHIHKMLDSIDYMVIRNMTEVVEAYRMYYNPIEAFLQMDISKESFYENVFNKHPTRKQGKLKYYNINEYQIVIHLYEAAPKKLMYGRPPAEEKSIINSRFYQITCKEEEIDKLKREAAA